MRHRLNTEVGKKEGEGGGAMSNRTPGWSRDFPEVRRKPILSVKASEECGEYAESA